MTLFFTNYTIIVCFENLILGITFYRLCLFYCQFIFYLEGVLFTFMRNYVVTFAKSLVVGSTMLVPGVSGGSMAMILGIYTKLISSVSSFMKK